MANWNLDNFTLQQHQTLWFVIVFAKCSYDQSLLYFYVNNYNTSTLQFKNYLLFLCQIQLLSTDYFFSWDIWDSFNIRIKKSVGHTESLKRAHGVNVSLSSCHNTADTEKISGHCLKEMPSFV